MEKHKLDILLEDLTNMAKDTVLDVKVDASYNIRRKDGYSTTLLCAIRLEVNNVIIWYNTAQNNTPQPDEDFIKRIKDHWYNELLRYLVLTRLPIWQESTELHKRI